jgi:hypothetical protein
MANSMKSDVILYLMQTNRDEGERLQEQAEKRVGYFLAIVSASIALLTYKINSIPDSDFVMLLLLAILLAYGLETLQFLNWTKIHERTNKYVGDIVSKDFATLSDTANNVIIEIATAQKRVPKTLLCGIRGGLAEFMYLTNSFLLTGIAFIGVKYIPIGNICEISMLAIIFIGFIFIQYFVSQKIRSIGNK